MTLLPSRAVGLMVRGVFGLLAAFALLAPLLGVSASSFSAALFWAASAWWAFRIVGNLLWPRVSEERRHNDRLKLGHVQDLRESAAGSAVGGLVFLVAFQYAKLSIVWAVLAGVAFFASLGSLLGSWIAQSNPDKFPAPEPLTEAQLSRRARAFRRSQIILVALLATWLYAWWGLAAQQGAAADVAQRVPIDLW
jgi:hypothetical protein